MDQHTDQHHHFEPRVEDDALIRGHGRFVEDAPQPNQAYGVFVRSPHAHARIRTIDIEAARAAPGVVAVLTHRDLDAAGVGNTSVHPPLAGRNGTKLVMPFRPALARERVMHVGQPVALVVAESIAQAQDAGELIAIDYETIDAVADVRAALGAGAPQLWPEAPGNLAIDWPGPVTDDGSNAHEIEDIFSSAPHVARVSVVNQRLVVATMEPRGATARYDAATDRYTLRSCSQGTGPQQLPEILKALLTHGFAADESAAIVYDGTLPAQQTIDGTLQELVDSKALLPKPGILIVGRVTALRQHLRWFDERPLFGKRIVVTRSRVRNEDRRLPGISEPARRREAHRPPSRLDGNALGVVSERSAGTRHGHRGRACYRPEGQVPRPAGEAHRQHGRIYRRAGREHSDQ